MAISLCDTCKMKGLVLVITGTNDKVSTQEELRKKQRFEEIVNVAKLSNGNYAIVEQSKDGDFARLTVLKRNTNKINEEIYGNDIQEVCDIYTETHAI